MEFVTNVGRRDKDKFTGEVGGWVVIGNRSLNGYEYNPLLRNVTRPGKPLRFEDIGYHAGADCIEDCRAGALADLDRDGRLELVLLPLGGAAIVLDNVTPRHNRRWVTLSLRGKRNRFAVGATVYVKAGGRLFRRDVVTGAGYLAGQPAELHVGLGEIESIDEVIVRWPNGEESTHRNLAVDKHHTLREP